MTEPKVKFDVPTSAPTSTEVTPVFGVKQPKVTGNSSGPEIDFEQFLEKLSDPKTLEVFKRLKDR